MKTISQEQIKSLLDELVRLNIPVQSFIGIEQMFANLPLKIESTAPQKAEEKKTAE